ncbi:MAG: LLM class flavin-dependent oxidoreductase [Burkholderiaceae bacterium]|jgi:FMN-dependent oxidoreductase (nitrilotriacetate monooxygenase family)|nr:LLM class flavin-dependent oxidoreductase [Burkholderiaceae bacterium]
MPNHKHIPFGIMLQGPGSHMNSWRHPASLADASVNLRYYIETIQKAEAAGIAFAFVADGLYINAKTIPIHLNRFEPLTILSALATVTSRIGLAGTVSTTYSDPFTVARQFASLDLISGGRAGWNVVTSPLEGSALNFGRSQAVQHPPHPERYRIAREYLEVAKGLWDSWDDDAFVRDRATGQFFDPAKLHALGHKGEYFQVEGPLNIQRSPQGQPVIFQAGSSDDGIDLAGQHADAVFTHATAVQEGVQFRERVRKRATAHGRAANSVGIYPGAGIVTGRTEAEAEEKYQAIRALVDIEDALRYLGRYFDHHDFTGYRLDAPFPELGEIGRNSFRSTTDHIKRTAAEKKQTLREAALEAATPRTPFVGSAEKVANTLIAWRDAGAADGYILSFPVIREGLADFIELILPLLQARGYFSPVLQGRTLRENLGLPCKTSRYAAQSQPAPV